METHVFQQQTVARRYMQELGVAPMAWGPLAEGKNERELAEAGLEALKNWMLEIGLPLTISELGATAEMIPGITETTVVYPAGYLNLTKEDITEILMESM